MTHLDEKALRAAAKEYNDSLAGYHFGATERIVRAYLSALPSSPVSELVDVTQPIDDIYVRDGFCDWADVANARDEVRNLHATTLTSLSTRNADLEREVKRLRDLLQEIEDSADLTAAMSGHLYDRLIDALSTSPQGGEHE